MLILLAGGAFMLGFPGRRDTASGRLVLCVGLACLLNGILWQLGIPFPYASQASPLDSHILMIYGACLVLYPHIHRRPRLLGHGLGAAAFLLMLAGSVFLFGYMYRGPWIRAAEAAEWRAPSFLASGGIAALSLAILAGLEPVFFPLQFLTGPSLQVRLLRTFLPLGIGSIFIYSLLFYAVFRSANPALSSVVGVFLVTLFLGALVIRSSSAMSHQIERAIRESEKRFAVLVDALKEYALFMVDPQGFILTWNAGAERMTGYCAEEAVGKHISIFYPPGDRDQGGPARALEQALSQGSYQEQGWRRRRDQSQFWADVVMTPARDDTDSLLGFSTVLRDVTDRRRDEEAIRQKTAFVELLQRVSSAANESSSLEEAMRICLDQVCRHTGWPVGHGWVLLEEGKALGSAVWHSTPPRRWESFQEKTDRMSLPLGGCLPGKVFATGKPVWIRDISAEPDFLRRRIARAAGLRSAFSSPILVGSQVVGVLEFFSDKEVPVNNDLLEVMVHVGAQLGRVAERQRSESQLKATLGMREVLIKELHHRVKNNLQIISSLLRLQSEHVRDPSSAGIFKESQSRLRSMALVHEHLYASRDLARIDFSNYLQGLVSGLIRSYAADPALLSVHIDSENIAVDLDTAIPCGMITTELVSNALKYAFPDRRKGDLWVGFHERGPNAYGLTVQDNGIGLPKGIRLDQTNSLGLRLVNTLVRQLNGEVHFEGNSGAKFDIAFKWTPRGGIR